MLIPLLSQRSPLLWSILSPFMVKVLPLSGQSHPPFKKLFSETDTNEGAFGDGKDIKR